MAAAIDWILKLGGSLGERDELPLWLEAMAGCNVVVVPGGGRFADTVREAQGRWRFDDRVAHAMAILGMAQYGRMLQGICPRLRLGEDRATIEHWLACGESVVWLPGGEVLAERCLAASWDLTSDSLAAWLARQWSAKRLLLVKSVTPAPRISKLGDLVAAGVIDRAFPTIAEHQAFQTWLSGPDNHAVLADGLARPAVHFTQVVPGSSSIPE